MRNRVAYKCLFGCGLGASLYVTQVEKVKHCCETFVEKRLEECCAM